MLTSNWRYGSLLWPLPGLPSSPMRAVSRSAAPVRLAAPTLGIEKLMLYGWPLW